MEHPGVLAHDCSLWKTEVPPCCVVVAVVVVAVVVVAVAVAVVVVVVVVVVAVVAVVVAAAAEKRPLRAPKNANGQLSEHPALAAAAQVRRP